MLVTEISTNYAGYTGQVLRTFTIGEEPTPEYQRLHDVAMEAFDRIAGVIMAGAGTAEALEAADVVHERGFTVYDDVVHGASQLPPILRTSKTSRGAPPDFRFETDMCLVIQPNVVTEDGLRGVQFGEMMRVTDTGLEKMHDWPAGADRVPQRMIVETESPDRPVAGRRRGRAATVRARALWFGVAAALCAWLPAAAAADDAVQRGKYLARAGLCIACHTDFKNKGAELAGGYAIEVPFGKIYSTNITPDPDTGIGLWSDKDFLDAMRSGTGRRGQHLFPAFPYTSFTNMTDEDILALKAYLFTVKPVRPENREPELTVPFNWRFLLAGWKWRYFEEGPWTPDPASPPDGTAAPIWSGR